jgi:fucose 4-O-acetylase-like acetyltransferase
LHEKDRAMSAQRQRLPELDLAKGLAIFLVVLGHIGSRTPPQGNEWFAVLTRLIYEFHMPFFMFLSGAVFQITFKPNLGFSGAGKYLRSRAARLLPAFFLFALFVWGAKLVAARFIFVDNTRGADLTELLYIFIRPTESVAVSLWYIYVLLQLYVLAAVVLTLTGGRLRYLVLGAAALTTAFHVTPITSYLAANAVCEFALFFALGCVFAKNYDVLSAMFKSNSALFYLIFAFSFMVMFFTPYPHSKAVVGVCSLPALFAFASSFHSERDRSILFTLGEYTFTIYLLNTLFIGAGKAVAIEVGLWDGRGFLLSFPILLAAGVLGPIVAYRLVLAKMPLLAKISK